MEAQARSNTLNTRRFAHRPVQLVIVRANGPLFFSLGAASLLEANAQAYAERLLHFCAEDRVFCDWITNEWLPRKTARARELRHYIETTWPEFDWAAAWDQYRAMLEADSGPKRPTAAHEALARCVTAAESALFYRCLARWADDRRLRDMARSMASEEASSLPYFRAAFERRAKVQGFGVIAAWRTARACVRTARDTLLPIAFEVLGLQWGPNAPFAELGYPEFTARMRAVIERHGELGMPERLLLRPWKRHARLPTADVVARARPLFRPLIQAAA